jgi:hypothetical protein
LILAEAVHPLSRVASSQQVVAEAQGPSLLMLAATVAVRRMRSTQDESEQGALEEELVQLVADCKFARVFPALVVLM